MGVALPSYLWLNNNPITVVNIVSSKALEEEGLMDETSF